MHERRSLGSPSALQYLRDQLGQGKTLSSLLNQLDLGAGRIWTYLPPEVGDTMAHELLRQGGVVPLERAVPVSGSLYAFVPVIAPSKPIITRLIQYSLGDRADSCCVFEHALARPTDPIIARTDDIRYVFYDDEVYALLASPDVSGASVERAMQLTQSYLFLAALTRLPVGVGSTASGGHITLQDLRFFAEHTHTLIIGAYDGEGFLVWSRD